MKVLSELGKKVAFLIEELQELRKENAKLVEENAQLSAKVDMVSRSLEDDSKGLEKLNKEKELAKTMVGDLIKSIDLLVETEK